jgi:TM2 domain-containing membrane protein YozV
MQPANSGIAYLLWALCFFGICGGQRFYTGKVTSGLIYLFTFGVFGIGQLVDLALIPGMVDRRNTYLRGLKGGDQGTGPHPPITLNLGDLAELQRRSMSPMQKLLKAAQEHGGALSMAQAALHVELEPEEVKKLLQEAQRHGFAEIGNDPHSGAIRYYFDV